MGKFIDLTGKQFGRLTVIERVANTKQGTTQWLCKCECGNYKTITSGNLKNNLTQSCGCLHKERATNANIKHNQCYTRLYRIWWRMKERCCNSTDKRYKEYGGRGITICQEWQSDFQTFRVWAISNGYNDDLTIDRIDNDKGYSPDNCRWATQKEQQNNRRNNHRLTYGGRTQTVQQWADELHINSKTIITRLHRGWSIEKALNTP